MARRLFSIIDLGVRTKDVLDWFIVQRGVSTECGTGTSAKEQIDAGADTPVRPLHTCLRASHCSVDVPR
jgi:hypothetical protein